MTTFTAPWLGHQACTTDCEPTPVFRSEGGTKHSVRVYQQTLADYRSERILSLKDGQPCSALVLLSHLCQLAQTVAGEGYHLVLHDQLTFGRQSSPPCSFNYTVP